MGSAQIVSVIALAVSISAALFSYRLSRRSFKISAYHGATDRTLQLDQVFVNHPLLRPYFVDGVPVPEEGAVDAELRHRILAVAEFAVDILEDCWDNEDCYAGEDRDAWMRWIYQVFDSAPACQDLYAGAVDWYPSLTWLFWEWGAPTEAMWEGIEAQPPKPPPSLPQRLSLGLRGLRLWLRLRLRRLRLRRR